MGTVSTSMISSEGQEVLEEIHASFSFDDYNEGRDIASEAGLVTRGEGTGRVVFDVPSDIGPSDVVVKVSKNIVGLQANQTEVSTFERAPDGLRKHLAPVAGTGEWVIMKKCKPGDSEAVDDILFYFLNEGVYCADSEIRVDNVGILNGQPVLMDYGFGLTF